MTRVTVLPSNIEFDAPVGDTLMGAARAQGFYWPTTCGGQGICTTCLSEIVSGSASLAEMARYEKKTLTAERGEAILRRPVRLACQAVVCGEEPIVLTKAGVRTPDL